MPKWKQEYSTVWMGGTVKCANAEDDAEAQYIVTMHNADIDALTEEIQQFRDAYVHDREIMADNVAQLGSYEARIDALTAERDELQGRIDTACERLESFCAEVDEVEAERDELQRRIAQILDRLPEGGVWCYDCNRATVPIRCESFYEHIPREYKQMKTTFHCPICKRETYAKDSCVDSLRAIAEGREV